VLGPLPEGRRDPLFDLAVELLAAADSGFDLARFAEPISAMTSPPG
jgi:hypothetical protein